MKAFLSPWALLALPALLPAAAAPVLPAPCRVVVYRNYDFVFGYSVALRLAPGCAAGGVGRVRKSSTMNVKSAGAGYQPVRPLKGAWTVTADGSSVPASELTIYSWSTWEFQDYWSGQWRRAELR